jgi:DNA mismatch repair ATPase MutS
MMQQYFEVKRGLAADTLLLFRLGDFYEISTKTPNSVLKSSVSR